MLLKKKSQSNINTKTIIQTFLKFKKQKQKNLAYWEKYCVPENTDSDDQSKTYSGKLLDFKEKEKD